MTRPSQTCDARVEADDLGLRYRAVCACGWVAYATNDRDEAEGAALVHTSRKGSS